MSSPSSFFWYDYVIFISTLAVSASIGVYFGCFGSKQSTTNDYLMGHRKMKQLPVGLSIAVSHFAAIMLISGPADTYRYGGYALFACVSPILTAVVTIFVYLPIFFNLQITSVYEYLEKRFDRRTRLLGSSFYILYEAITGAFIIYSPSLLISASTRINANIICIGLYLICLFYTAIGGLKTVIWTDLFQFVVILGCLILIYIVGLVSNGGLIAVWEKAIEGERLDIFDFDIDPTRRDGFWIFVIGYTFYCISYISLSQGGMQKYLTLPSFQKCIWAAMYSAASFILVLMLCISIGLTMYAEYSQCDPMLSQKIRRHDEMISYFILDTMKHIYGIAGLFFAALACSSLSTVSCSLNAMSAVIYKDFLSGFFKNIGDKKATKILKLVVVLCGVVGICITQLMQQVKEILPVGIGIIGTILGPSMGIFTLAVLFPQANAKGAFFGGIGGFVLVGSILFPKHYFQNIIYPSKPLGVSGCENNFTLVLNTTNIGTPTAPFVFRISHNYNCLIGTVITVILGLIVSRITKDTTQVDEMLIASFVRRRISRKSQKRENVLEKLMTERTG